MLICSFFVYIIICKTIYFISNSYFNVNFLFSPLNSSTNWIRSGEVARHETFNGTGNFELYANSLVYLLSIVSNGNSTSLYILSRYAYNRSFIAIPIDAVSSITVEATENVVNISFTNGYFSAVIFKLW